MDIKAIRNQLGMTQSEFANHVGVSVRTIIRWEQSGTQPLPHFKTRIIEMCREESESEDKLELFKEVLCMVTNQRQHLTVMKVGKAMGLSLEDVIQAFDDANVF
ncbi:MAG: helix-turn-helix domain-containing protein [Weeksellaceae bacterium]